MEDLKTEDKKVECCPVCYGKGFVPQGFYSSTGMSWTSDGSGTELCKSCYGKGYIVV